MDELRSFLNSLSVAEQVDFAGRCRTSIGYLRKAISTKQRLGEGLCARIEKESLGRVRCEQLRPDLSDQWRYLRGEISVASANTPPLKRHRYHPRGVQSPSTDLFVALGDEAST